MSVDDWTGLKLYGQLRRTYSGLGRRDKDAYENYVGLAWCADAVTIHYGQAVWQSVQNGFNSLSDTKLYKTLGFAK